MDVYGLDSLSAHHTKKKHGIDSPSGIMEVYTLDGKLVASNVLKAGPWDADQERRLVRNGFPKTFSYSCPFSFGPDCVYIASQDYLFCIGE